MERLYHAAFPDEDLLPLVSQLLEAVSGVLSLVGVAESSLVGHVVFTPCTVAGYDQQLALLGPLAVAPAWQRQGIGGALVRTGLQRLESAGVARVYVLGDPAYYQRLGFAPEAEVQPPYALPAAWREAWQSTFLRPGGPPCWGALSVARPWRQRALWAS